MTLRDLSIPDCNSRKTLLVSYCLAVGLGGGESADAPGYVSCSGRLCTQRRHFTSDFLFSKKGSIVLHLSNEPVRGSDLPDIIPSKQQNHKAQLEAMLRTNPRFEWRICYATSPGIKKRYWTLPNAYAIPECLNIRQRYGKRPSTTHHERPKQQPRTRPWPSLA